MSESTPPAQPTLLQFYHVGENTPAAVDAVLPPLLLKAYGNGQPVLLLCPTLERMRRLDELLWTFAASSFLPHNMANGAADASQPVVLALPEDLTATPAHAQHLSGPRLPVLLAGAEAALPELLAGNPQKICYLFSALPADVERARGHYKSHRAQGGEVAYFQQSEGRWERKG